MTPDQKIHPAADQMYRMDEKTYAAFKRDIEMHGQMQPIIVDKAGAILDGRHRYWACMELGIEPKFETWTNGEMTPEQFVESQNLHRRHLTMKQKKEWALRLKKDNPDMSNRAIATVVNLDHKTVKSTVKSLDDNGLGKSAEIPQPPKNPGARRNRAQVAKGEGLINSVRKGLGIESDVGRIEAALERVSCSPSTYQRLRKIVWLADQSWLTEPDKRAVDNVLLEAEQFGTLKSVEKVKDLVTRALGSKKREGPLSSIYEKRNREFVSQISVLESTCRCALDLEIPYLPEEDLNDVCRTLSAARSAIAKLEKAIRKQRGPAR